MTDLVSKRAETNDASDANDGDRRPYRDGDAIAAMTDARLVIAISRGRRAAFAEAYHRHAGPVYALAARLCGPDVAADVTEEVFTTLWSAPERFYGQNGPLSSFLVAQANGRAVDRLRADTGRRIRESNTAAPRPHRTGSERKALARLTGTEAYKMLSDVPAPTAQAIMLAYFAGYTYRQVANQLGQPEGTIKSRIRSGLTQLVSKLDDYKPPATS